LLAHDFSDLTGEELLRVCADLRDSRAWDELIRRFHPVIYAAITRTGRRYEQFHPSLCDDLAQEIYLKLTAHGAKALREFVPLHEGSAFGYVQVIAVRVAHDYFKKKNLRPMHELAADLPDTAAPDKTHWLALQREIDTLLRQHATDRDRRIFWLHYLRGMTAKEIAALPCTELTIKGVESVLMRLKRVIQENTAYGQRE
jgi:RNA polymerase sigma factor (sigma-70 family)